MAKKSMEAELVDEVRDPEPQVVRPFAPVATAPAASALPPTPPQMAPDRSSAVKHEAAAPVATAAPAPPVPKSAAFPWGFLVKHPSYGALRVRQDEASTEVEAKEVFRKARCPHLSMELLDRSGFRVSAVAFTPAATEIGKD